MITVKTENSSDDGYDCHHQQIEKGSKVFQKHFVRPEYESVDSQDKEWNAWRPWSGRDSCH